MGITRWYKTGISHVGINESNYEGKPTKSYVLSHKKKNKDTGKWEEVAFYSKTDLLDMYASMTLAMREFVKLTDVSKNTDGNIKPEYNQQQNPQQVAAALDPFTNQETPF